MFLFTIFYQFSPHNDVSSSLLECRLSICNGRELLKYTTCKKDALGAFFKKQKALKYIFICNGCDGPRTCLLSWQVLVGVGLNRERETPSQGYKQHGKTNEGSSISILKYFSFFRKITIFICNILGL